MRKLNNLDLTKITEFVKNKYKDLKEDFLFLFKRKNLTKTSSIFLVLAILLTGLGFNSKKKENKENEDPYNK